MKLILIVVISIVFSACSLQLKSWKNLKHVRTGDQYTEIFSVKAPEGYSVTSVKTGEANKSKLYRYQDSTLLYLSTMPNTPNEHQIIESHETVRKGTRLLRRRVKFKGRFKDLHWKEISLGNVKFGYKNAPESRKAEFDKALNSVKKCSPFLFFLTCKPIDIDTIPGAEAIDLKSGKQENEKD